MRGLIAIAALLAFSGAWAESAAKGIKATLDREKGILVVWHPYEPSAICRIRVDGVQVAQESVRAGERWTYQHDDSFTNKQTIEPNCAQGGYDLFSVEKDGQELVIRNISTSTRVCRILIKGEPTVDEVITRGSARSFKKDPLAAYQVDCNRGTEYMGRLSKAPM